jgi:hypothetical protein
MARSVIALDKSLALISSDLEAVGLLRERRVRIVVRQRLFTMYPTI